MPSPLATAAWRLRPVRCSARCLTTAAASACPAGADTRHRLHSALRRRRRGVRAAGINLVCGAGGAGHPCLGHGNPAGAGVGAERLRRRRGTAGAFFGLFYYVLIGAGLLAAGWGQSLGTSLLVCAGVSMLAGWRYIIVLNEVR